MLPTTCTLPPARQIREHHLARWSYADLEHVYGLLHRRRCAVCARIAPALGLAWADLRAEAGL